MWSQHWEKMYVYCLSSQMEGFPPTFTQTATVAEPCLQKMLEIIVSFNTE